MAALDLQTLSLSNRANEEIAQVRAKANTEAVALNAGLRKEQMKVESLERAVLQKVGGCLNVLEFVFLYFHLSPSPLCSSQNQEIEELTKICDELIAKLGTE